MKNNLQLTHPLTLIKKYLLALLLIVIAAPSTFAEDNLGSI